MTMFEFPIFPWQIFSELVTGQSECWAAAGQHGHNCRKNTAAIYSFTLCINCFSMGMAVENWGIRGVNTLDKCVFKVFSDTDFNFLYDNKVKICPMTPFDVRLYAAPCWVGRSGAHSAGQGQGGQWATIAWQWDTCTRDPSRHEQWQHRARPPAGAGAAPAGNQCHQEK